MSGFDARIDESERYTEDAPDDIPSELRALPHWVTWEPEQNDPDDPAKITKVPYQAYRGRKSPWKAMANNPETWATYGDVHDLPRRGFEFGVEGQLSGYTGIDADDPTENGWDDFALWLQQELNSYISISPSRKGWHAYVAGSIPSPVKIDHGETAGVKHVTLEMYDRERYFTETGEAMPFGRKPIRADQQILITLHTALTLYKQHVLGWLRQHGKKDAGKEFAALWNRTESNVDDSSRDFALAYKVARWAKGDVRVADMLFRLSGRYRSERCDKWDDLHGSNYDAEGKIIEELPEEAQLTYGQLTIGRQCRAWRARRQRLEAERARLDAATTRLLLHADTDDAGNAECFTALYQHEFRFDHDSNQWRQFDGVIWREYRSNPTQAVEEMMRLRKELADLLDDEEAAAFLKTAMATGKSVTRLQGILALAKDHAPIKAEARDFNGNLQLLATQNGVLNLATGEFRAGRPDDMLSRQLGAEYDPEARCPRWERFLSEVFGGNEETVAYIQRAIGYTVSGMTTEQVLFLLLGIGANGKSTFLRVLSALFNLKHYAGNASFSMFDADHQSSGSEDVARLDGTRFLTIIEANEDRRLNEAKVKSVTGGDTITAAYKYGHYFDFVPRFVPWVAMNRAPNITGTDNGIWRRVKRVPFKQNFEQSPTKDKNLPEKLIATELPGILNWVLAGYRAWQAQGLGTCPEVEEATQQYREDSDVLGQWLAENTERKPECTMKSIEAYQNFCLFAQSRGIKHPMTHKAWGISMGERGYTTRRIDVPRSRGDKRPVKVTVYDDVVLDDPTPDIYNT